VNLFLWTLVLFLGCAVEISGKAHREQSELWGSALVRRGEERTVQWPSGFCVSPGESGHYGFRRKR
jgi:hypothetical protein